MGGGWGYTPPPRETPPPPGTHPPETTTAADGRYAFYWNTFLSTYNSANIELNSDVDLQREVVILTVTRGGVVDELRTELREELQSILLHGFGGPRVLTVQLLVLYLLNVTTLTVPNTVPDRGRRGRVSRHRLKQRGCGMKQVCPTNISDPAKWRQSETHCLTRVPQ